MPVYEYQCDRCSSRFDVRCGLEDRNGARCPSCGGKSRRLFSAVPIIFNGSGFYTTDNRKNGSTPEKSKEAVTSGEKTD
jgi:putative FmdB family regulatory protein